MGLANPNDVAQVNGETLVDQNGSALVEVPTAVEAQQRVVATRRRLIDLPDVPERMNTLGLVLAYELFGLFPNDVAIATGLTLEQVTNIMMLDAYSELRSTVVEGIVDQDAQGVRDTFMQKAQRSAERIVELAESTRPDIALSASKEVLDRGGHSVRQIIEHQHKMEGGLRIEIIRRDNSQEVPTLDLAPVEEVKE